MKQLVKAFEDGILTKKDDFIFPKKVLQKYSDEPDDILDPILYPENEEEKMYPFEDMPIIFHRVWKNINIEKLQELKTNASWMNLDVWLCDSCFFKYAETTKPFHREVKIPKSQAEEDELMLTPEGKTGDRSQRAYNSNGPVLKGSKTTLLTLSKGEPSKLSDEHAGVLKSKLTASHSVSQMYKLGQTLGLPRDRLVSRPFLNQNDLRYPILGNSYALQDKVTDDSKADTKEDDSRVSLKKQNSINQTSRTKEYVRKMHKSAVSEVLLPRLKIPAKEKKPVLDTSLFGSSHSRHMSSSIRKVDYESCLDVLRETEKYRKLLES